MEKETKILQEELEKARSQLYIFYELTKAMRTTLRMDEIIYIILTGLTAHQGLAFNRAILFLVDEESKNIKGFMGVGPVDVQEARDIWSNIENEKKDLYDLIKTYRRIKEGKIKPKFMEFVQSLCFPFHEENSFIYKAIYEKKAAPVDVDRIAEFGNDPFINKLNLKEFLFSPLWIKERPAGIIVVDNYITGKLITDADVKIFNMFVEQAAGAIENSQEFENTLIKSHTDALTSLWNHGYFQYKLDEEITNLQSKSYSLSIMMLDIDDFKKFNDTHGHIYGDIALKTISQILKENSRKVDVICRYGGEEFSIILPRTNREEAFLIGERIRNSVQQQEILSKRFTVSIGITSSTYGEIAEKQTLLKKADDALYEAKRSGKNRVILST